MLHSPHCAVILCARSHFSALWGNGVRSRLTDEKTALGSPAFQARKLEPGSPVRVAPQSGLFNVPSSSWVCARLCPCPRCDGAGCWLLCASAAPQQTDAERGLAVGLLGGRGDEARKCTEWSWPVLGAQVRLGHICSSSSSFSRSS